MINTILSIIANVFSIFGITIDSKKISNKLKKNKAFRKICLISFLCICCVLIIRFIISKQKSITVTNVTLSENSLTMSINESHILTAKVLYSNNTMDEDILWISSNDSIATVDQNGIVTALNNGNVTIIAQASKNNTTEIAECTITIKSPPSGYSISVHQLSEDSYAYVYIKPYESDITNIQIYGKSPSGEIFAPNKDENDLYHFSECGSWIIYASVKNDAGIYEAQKPEDFAKIEVTNITDTLGDSISTLNNMLRQLVP